MLCLVLSLLDLCRITHVGPNSPHVPDLPAVAAGEGLLVDIPGWRTYLAFPPPGAGIWQQLNMHSMLS